jgi:hypothetical protein
MSVDRETSRKISAVNKNIAEPKSLRQLIRWRTNCGLDGDRGGFPRLAAGLD